MMPIVFAVGGVDENGPLLYVGLPTLASLSVTHGYCRRTPPDGHRHHVRADIGTTLIYGIIIAIPAIIVAGADPLAGLKKVDPGPDGRSSPARR